MSNTRYDSFDNENIGQKTQLGKDKKSIPRSAHNFSFTHAGNTLFGLLAPIDCFDVVPNESIDMSITALLEFRNPTTRRLLNGFRVFFHSRYHDITDLWEGAKNFIDRGRRGDITKVRPNLLYHFELLTNNYTVYQAVNANTPLSLLNFLGLPASRFSVAHQGTIRSHLRSFQAAFYGRDANSFIVNSLQVGKDTDFFPAEVAFAYQRDWRDFYCNKNLLQNNKFWFPNNEDHFILSYNCWRAVAINYENEDFSANIGDTTSHWYAKVAENLTGFEWSWDDAANSITPYYEDDYHLSYVDTLDTTPEPNNPTSVVFPTGLSPDYMRMPNLSGIKFVQFRADRFTSASPFPDLLRGDAPILQLTEDNFVRLQRDNVQYPFSSSQVEANAQLLGGVVNNSRATFAVTGHGAYQVVTPPSSVTMSDIYTLETLTAFKRKLGATNGDYNESIMALFGGHNPRVHDRKSRYIGGFYQDFDISGVMQTSASTNDGSPLGTKAGQGISAGRGQIGHFEVPNYGWIITYMFVVPEVFYTGGKPRMFSKKLPTDMYYPLFNNLPAQEVRNDELYISGDETKDSQPFGYEPRYEEYKGRPNRISGYMGLSPEVAVFDSARIMARRFSDTPALNHQFVTCLPENVDMSAFTVVDEPPLDFNVGVQVRRVFPGPYVAIEGDLSNSGL